MSFSMVSFGDLVTAADLAMKIVQVLYYSPSASEDYQGALSELVSLHHELVIISDAIQLADTASGPGALIRHRVAEEGVAATGVVGVLSKVWWAASEQRELRVLRDAVARRRAALSILIGSSNLLISTATRDEVHACRETIQELTTTLKPVPHHVVEDMVFIVDPLGDVIRISMIYGLKYEVLRENLVSHFDDEHFARIYTASSRRTIQKVGLEAVHIKDGLYHLLHSSEGLISQLSPAGMVLKQGMTLEMSMLLRERANFFKQRKSCPRCKDESKSEPIARTGWRKCLRCSKFFQVVPDDFSRDSQARIQRFSSLRHGTPKDGPKQHSDDDGVEHFRRIEFFCVEEMLVGSCSVPVP
ncbi:hypothetical protein B0H14DRAFT_2767246 [Mycena olivaceomarginata]|nr:hypothetical protein B0H14DRAFT_2767246 [Mycena olivaceomarginata]